MAATPRGDSLDARILVEEHTAQFGVVTYPELAL
jgi:hypothetical protein